MDKWRGEKWIVELRCPGRQKTQDSVGCFDGFLLGAMDLALVPKLEHHEHRQSTKKDSYN
jgi:hypothetical protein